MDMNPQYAFRYWCMIHVLKNQQGKAYDQMALNIDIVPTILELAGIAPDVTMQGKPLTHI